MNYENNIIFNTDSYKVSMFNQYPPGTNTVYSYIESRGGKYDYTVFFGLQAAIEKYLVTPITHADIDEAEKLLTLHGLPFNREGWEYIVDCHAGYLPVEIKAVREGSVVPVKNVLLTIENTDPKCYWLTTYLETMLLRAIWYPTTVATQSHSIKQVIKRELELTGDVSGLPFKLHDFGARGASSYESAGIGGAAHLVNFSGTDTIVGMLFAMKYYGANPTPGVSIPAMEHSTVTSWGRANESQAYRNMLEQYAKPGAILACVSDSYDVFNAAENIWGEELKAEVVNSGATLVIRPDSGDPVSVNVQLVKILGEKFGYTLNSKGYKVLNNVRLIQGDGIDEGVIADILAAFRTRGWSADNIAFGMGGALLQKVDRDTQKFAMKCSAIQVGDRWVEVRKDPITDPGKMSKAGRVTLYKDEEGYYSGVEDWKDSELELVYANGVLIRYQSFDEIRELAE